MGLRIIDVSIIDNPIQLGYFYTGGQVRDITVQGNYAYVADQEDGLYIIRDDKSTSISDEYMPVTKIFALNQNYPNPFNPTTKISYSISRSDFVTLKVYNIRGQEIQILVNKYQSSGDYAGRERSLYTTRLFLKISDS